MDWTKIMIVLLSILMSSIECAQDYYRASRGTSYQEQNPFLAQNVHNNHDAECHDQTSSHSNLEIRSTRHDSSKPDSDQSMIFPSDLHKEDCPHGLCVNVTNYPKEHIKTLLTKSKLSKSFFKVSEEVVNVHNRFSVNDISLPFSLCETRTQTIYPQKARNLRKTEKIIVNLEEHKQGIVFETCMENSNTGCKFSSNFPTGYTSFCQQKFVNKKLMVLGEGEEDFVFDTFEVPSCCVCMVNKTN